MTNNTSPSFEGVKDDIANAEAPAMPAHPPGWPLPPDCPVTPLGHCDDRFSYMDSCHQIITLKSEKHNRLNIESLFLRDFDWLRKHYARYGNNGEVNGFRIDQVARDLRQGCALQGIWDPEAKCRGLGTWPDGDGHLVMHCGDRVWHQGKLIKPAVINGHVYPAMPPVPPPLVDPPDPDDDPGGELFNELMTWNWRRGQLDAGLLVGWVAAALLGGVLTWRPAVWITGDKGTGKSTVHELLKLVFAGGVVATSDATSAGIWQSLGQDSTPVILDEQEAETDNRRSTNLLKLARQASSGGAVLRGGADHKGSEFRVRSCFLFSSIIVPPMQPQDRSRIAVLQLDELVNRDIPNLSADFWKQRCRMLKRRLIDQWSRLEGTRACYGEALRDIGHDARGADQFGTLLTCFDLLMFETVPDEARLLTWTKGLEPMEVEEAINGGADWHLSASYLLESIVQTLKGGDKMNVLEWIRKADEDSEGNFNIDMDLEAVRVLARVGMRLYVEVKTDVPDRPAGSKWLAIANGHSGLAAIYKDTQWGNVSGSASGGWGQSLKRAPGASAKTMRIQGRPVRCTLMPWDLVFPDGQGED